MSTVTVPPSTSTAHSTQGQFASTIEQYRPDLVPYESIYKHLHSHPELSHLEKETSAEVAKQLKSISSYLDIRTSIGGHGLVGIFRNGPGKTLLLRADMDGLPVEEKTGLPYASTATMRDTDGLVKSTMHACGHDMHMTGLLAATQLLISARQHWSGTLISLFQPAEEKGAGAQRMVDDGLYDTTKHNVPIPDIVLGQHIHPFRHGNVGCKHGTLMCAANSFNVTVHGRGSHGSYPHNSIDPIPIAASIVLKLQTIVAREVPPSEVAVVTVGSLQAGHTENIISDSAVLKLNVRTQSDEWRDKIIKSIKRIVKAECEAGGCEKSPTIEETSSFPLTVNDGSLKDSLDQSFEAYFGKEFNSDQPLVFASEDFSILGTAVGKPTCFWLVDSVAEEQWQEAEKKGRLVEDIPSNHSPLYAPVIQPTLKNCVDALSVGALTFLGKK